MSCLPLNEPVKPDIDLLEKAVKNNTGIERETVLGLIERCRLAESRLSAVLNTVSEAVCIIDEKDQVAVWNEQAEKLYGITAGEIVGRPIEQFFSNLLLTKVMKERQPVKERYHKPCPGKHVLINAQPVKVNGNIAGGVCAERDITEVVQLNEKLYKTSKEVENLKQQISNYDNDCFATVYGSSKLITEAVELGRRVARTGIPVLLRGESGTGKELFARAIHEASGRQGAFVPINCGAVPAGLFESELFGYNPGAFTGADRKGKEGLLEKADKGTLFLDEIGDMPKDIQVKLLRVLQDKSFYKIGGSRPLKVDVRVVAATHRNLEQMMAEKEFREDLYYRLNVVTITLPSLRERIDDIPELVHKGLRHFGAIHGKRIKKVSPAAMSALLEYPWPGNVRELFNMLERLVVLADSDTIGVEALPAGITGAGQNMACYDLPDNCNLVNATSTIEKNIIERVLREANYNKAAAAKKLGIPRSTLYYKMQQLGLKCQ